jgi:hypothetical protein
MTEEDYFYNINVPIDFIDTVYEELTRAKWYNAASGLIRSEIVGETRTLIEKNMPFKVNCCGFYKNDPLWKYPIHKDRYRFAAFNVQLGEDSEDYYVNAYTDDRTEKIRIPYHKDCPILLNTKKFHSVHNMSNEKVRYVLTVGCADMTYEIIRDRFKQMEIDQHKDVVIHSIGSM